MVSCYIIDDERYAVEAMTRYVERIPGFSVAGAFTDPFMALENISRGNIPDLVLLDVNMPKLSGMDVVTLLPEEVLIILTTGHARYAVDAFEHRIADFLLKPVSFERFARAMAKAQKLLSGRQNAKNDEKDSLFINTKTKGSVVQIRKGDINYLESVGRNIVLHMPNGNHTTHLAFKDIQPDLPSESFIRIHRSYVINKTHITQISGGHVHMANGGVLPIGDAYKAQFMEKIAASVVKKN